MVRNYINGIVVGHPVLLVPLLVVLLWWEVWLIDGPVGAVVVGGVGAVATTRTLIKRREHRKDERGVIRASSFRMCNEEIVRWCDEVAAAAAAAGMLHCRKRWKQVCVC